jgi:hypothetical protein
MASTAHALQEVQVRLKSVGNEGQFTHKAETLFRPCLPSHCSGVTEIYNMPVTAHALRVVQSRVISVGNEGYFTLEDERVSRPYLPSHCSGVTEI